MTLKGGSSQACAACKYQRRRCKADCLLAPYFPADQPKVFQNAHRLFGVSKIVKILKHLDPSQKLIAMKSIIYQANIRDKHPVHGCLGIIEQLYYQIQMAQEELQAVHGQLAFYQQQQQEISISSSQNSVSQLQLSMVPPSTNAFTPSVQYNNLTTLPMGLHPSSSCWMQQQPCSNSSNNNGNQMVMQSQLICSHPQPLQPEEPQDYDEMHQFFDTIDDDDRQLYMDSKQDYESSSESSLKETQSVVEHVGEIELQSAAACFSLTSVN